MKVIKRSGQEVEFDQEKILNAIKKANASVEKEENRLSDAQIRKSVENVVKECESIGRAVSVE